MPAAAVGVQGAVQVGCDLESSRFTVNAVDLDSRLLGAVALHPNDAPGYARRGGLEEALAEIEELAAHPRIRAIGETGLDFFRTEGEGLVHQRYSFRRHIDIAKRLGLTLQIHDRDAHDDVVQVLREEGAPERVVFHCFSGGEALARTCNAEGWYMSFAGTVTFKNATDLREALAIAEPSRILVETDAPFLTPHPHRGPAERELHGSVHRAGHGRCDWVGAFRAVCADRRKYSAGVRILGLNRPHPAFRCSYRVCTNSWFLYNASITVVNY
ncbi:hypothetical protein NicSoilC12_10070 [Arthrobacter sp. NicSoilC12]|nr:hypothetical protein NicSoilC12_10070 [Arthrobacter sp. NicSoilC12]